MRSRTRAVRSHAGDLFARLRQGAFAAGGLRGGLRGRAALWLLGDAERGDRTTPMNKAHRTRERYRARKPRTLLSRRSDCGRRVACLVARSVRRDERRAAGPVVRREKDVHGFPGTRTWLSHDNEDFGRFSAASVNAKETDMSNRFWSQFKGIPGPGHHSRVPAYGA